MKAVGKCLVPRCCLYTSINFDIHWASISRNLREL